jgi:hypothetical protein
MKHARKDYDPIQDPKIVDLNGCCPLLIPEEEPVFLLRAQDPFAKRTVLYWATLAREAGADETIVQLAIDQAELMNVWPIKKDLPDLPSY